MQQQTLIDLIQNVLLPVYLEHYRLLGRPSPINEINRELLQAIKPPRPIARLLQKPKY
jgi:hypothetical protein